MHIGILVSCIVLHSVYLFYSIYHDAAIVMQKLEDKEGSLKSLVFTQRLAIPKKKAIFALITKTLQSKQLMCLCILV